MTSAEAPGTAGPFRVLLATDHYPPFIGGGQRQSWLLAHCLKAAGHSIEVATMWQDGLPEVEEEDGIRVHRLRQMRTLMTRGRSRAPQRHQPPFADPVTVLALRRVLRRFRPGIVHSHGWVGFSCAAALATSDTPLLLSARDFGYACAKRTLLFDGQPCSGPGIRKCLGCAADYYGTPKGWIAALGVLTHRPLLVRRTDGLHSVSSYVQSICHRDFTEPERAGRLRVDAVIPDFWVEPEQLTVEAERRLAELPERPFILFVGAFRRVKGINELLEAYVRLPSPPPLVLIGTIEQDTPKELPEGVKVLVNFPHAAVMRAWDRCLFGVTPSLLPEPFGTVVAEGMSRGKPIIGTRPGGHEDMIVDRETGLLVPRGDVAALVGAMTDLLEDEGLRERMGREARQRAELASARSVVAQFERLYAELLDHGRTAASA